VHETQRNENDVKFEKFSDTLPLVNRIQSNQVSDLNIDKKSNIQNVITDVKELSKEGKSIKIEIGKVVCFGPDKIVKNSRLWNKIVSFGNILSKNRAELVIDNNSNGFADALCLGATDVVGHIVEKCVIKSEIANIFSTYFQIFDTIVEKEEYMLTKHHTFIFFPGEAVLSMRLAFDFLKVWNLAIQKKNQKERIPKIICFAKPWNVFLKSYNFCVNLENHLDLIQIVDSEELMINLLNK